MRLRQPQPTPKATTCPHPSSNTVDILRGPVGLDTLTDDNHADLRLYPRDLHIVLTDRLDKHKLH